MMNNAGDLDRPASRSPAELWQGWRGHAAAASRGRRATRVVQIRRQLAGACLCVLTGMASVAAPEQLVPVMRLGHWLEVGGTPPMAWVLQAQERLKAAGFAPDAIDGTLGPQTREALRQYQMRHNLPITGALDEATRQALGIQ